jgi:uncharacterized membrane protein
MSELSEQPSPEPNKTEPQKMPTRAELDCTLTQVNKKVTAGLWATHASYAILLLLISWLNFQLPENGFGLWLFKIIPLAIFIPGFIKCYYRSYSWLCFAILFYFIWIIPLAVGRGAWSDWLVASLTVAIFIAAMMTSRWLQQQSYLTWQIHNTPS